ncbi:MAG: DUF4010 domain-containing protein [Gammaproteobacteria bacterium]|nr:DUF4010 domain-containing protein [Gammaproteobacteria bacterium]
MKLAGAKKGVMLTALTAGMASSTALTLHFSKLSRQQQGEMKSLLAAGILVACGTMFPRVVLVATLINPALFSGLIIPMVVMSLLTFLCCCNYLESEHKLSTSHAGAFKQSFGIKASSVFWCIISHRHSIREGINTFFW